MDDLISRQAAIDAIKEFYRGAKEWKDEQEERSDIWHRADSAIASALEIGLRIKKLPAAQPERITCQIGHDPTADETENLKKMLMGEPIVLLPSTQTEIIPLPEIIRCKDCKHYSRPHGCGHIDGMVTAQEDGFCSCAERITDE